MDVKYIFVLVRTHPNQDDLLVGAYRDLSQAHAAQYAENLKQPGDFGHYHVVTVPLHVIPHRMGRFTVWAYGVATRFA